MADRDIRAKFSIDGADASKQDLKKIQTALEDSGEAGQKSATKITAAFANIEKEQDKLEKKIESGKVVRERDGLATIQQLQVLDAQIKKTFGDLANAPTEIQEAYQKATKSADSTIKKVREMSDDLADQKQILKDGGTQWTSFGDVMNKALGPMGAVQAQLGAVGAALMAGWNIGKQFATSIGTDFSTMNGYIDDAKGRLNGFLGSLSDAAVASFTGDVQGMKDALKLSGASLKLSADELKGYKAALDLGITGLENYSDKADQLGKFQAFLNETEKLGADGLKLRNQVLREGVGDIDKTVVAIGNHAAALDKLKVAYEEQIKFQNAMKEGRKAEIEGLEALITKLNLEKDVRHKLAEGLSEQAIKEGYFADALKEANKVVKEADDVQGGYTKTTIEAAPIVAKLTQDYQHHSLELAKMADGITKSAEASKDKLSPEEYKRNIALGEMLKKYGDLAPEQRGQVQMWLDGALRLAVLNTDLGTHNSTIEITKTKTTEHGDAVKKSGDNLHDFAANLEATRGPLTANATAAGTAAGHLTDFGTGIADLIAKLPDYDSLIEASTTKMLAHANAALAAAKAVRDFNTALNEATSDSGGGTPKAITHNLGPAPASQPAPPPAPPVDIPWNIPGG